MSHKSDVLAVTELFDSIEKWACEYATGNTDYPDGYIHIVNETSAYWPEFVRDWVGEDYPDEIVDKICERLDGGFDCETIYYACEYAAYDGPGCCLYSDAIGEIEEQICINDHEVLKDLEARGELNGAIIDYNGDMYVKRWGDCLYGYVMPGGAWHFVVPEERMEELLTEAILDVCRQ